MLKKLIILFLLLFFLGCANPNLNLVDQTGQPLPNPYYVGQTIDQQMSFTYYIVAEHEVIDIDKSAQPYPKFLDRTTSTVMREGLKSLKLVLRVYNPSTMEYRVYADRGYNYKVAGREYRNYMQIATSNLPYREYTFPLPYESAFNGGFLEVLVSDKSGKQLFRVDKFKYSLQ